MSLHVRFEKHDAAAQPAQHRFYEIELVPLLPFDSFNWAVRRTWGRVGNRTGQVKTDWVADEAAARARVDQIAGQKRRKGYAPVAKAAMLGCF